ncbi:MAG TPA: hypothetical protein VEA69_19545, partial [Tepidisphaeraceae bacterium]|nr:hypothetical protein [Tepidisphaeraceae bacterium]
MAESSSIVNQATIKLGVEGVQQVEKAAAATQKLAKSVRDLNGAGGKGGVGGFVDSIQDRLGNRSTLKDLFEIGTGGGPIQGLTFAIDTIKRGADGIAELNRQFRSGKLAASEYFRGILDGVPILGNAVRMFDAIQAAMNGDPEGAIRATAAGTDIVTDAMRGTARGIRAARNAAIGPVRAAADNAVNLGLSGDALARNQAAQAMRNRLDDLDREQAEAERAVREGNAGGRAGLHALLATARGSIPSETVGRAGNVVNAADIAEAKARVKALEGQLQSLAATEER